MIYLTKNRDTWLEISSLPEDLMTYGTNDFKTLMSISPSELGKVVVIDKKTGEYKEKQIFRSFKSYGKTPKLDKSTDKSYMFTGEAEDVTINDKFPEKLMPFFDFAKSLDTSYNQSVVNWYLNGDNYIEMHSDCTAKMIEEHSVLLINLTDSTEAATDRTFTIQSREEAKENVIFADFNVKLENGMVIVMGGNFQKTFRHGVLADKDNGSQRMSLTFRQIA